MMDSARKSSVLLVCTCTQQTLKVAEAMAGALLGRSCGTCLAATRVHRPPQRRQVQPVPVPHPFLETPLRHDQVDAVTGQPEAHHQRPNDDRLVLVSVDPCPHLPQPGGGRRWREGRVKLHGQETGGGQQAEEHQRQVIPPVESFACTTVAAPAATSAQGCRKTPSPAAAHGERRSSLAIQVGGLRGRPLRRRCRTPKRIRTTPSAALTTRAPVDGTVLGCGGLPPVTRTTTAITTTRQASQPRMKASPFLVPFSAARIRMNATIVTGSKVIASPMIIRSSTTCPLLAGYAANAADCDASTRWYRRT